MSTIATSVKSTSGTVGAAAEAAETEAAAAVAVVANFEAGSGADAGRARIPTSPSPQSPALSGNDRVGGFVIGGRGFRAASAAAVNEA